jgi:hypothetical protein
MTGTTAEGLTTATFLPWDGHPDPHLLLEAASTAQAALGGKAACRER